jgi:hypothetical protein
LLFFFEEVTLSESKRMTLKFESDEYSDALYAIFGAVIGAQAFVGRFKMIEKEQSTGILFTRVDVHVDGRAFCTSGEEMGPTKYGFYNF